MSVKDIDDTLQEAVRSMAPNRVDPEPCETRHPSGLLCTRDRGHGGEHVAHDGRGRAVAQWPTDVLSIVPGRGISERDLEEMVRAELAAEREARLAAELRAEGLRRAAQELVDQLAVVHADPRYAGVWGFAQDRLGQYAGPRYVQQMEALAAALAAPPPDLGPLRELVRAVASDRRDYHEAAGEHAAYGDSSAEIYGALDSLLAVYPFLDPGAAGEVGR